MATLSPLPGNMTAYSKSIPVPIMSLVQLRRHLYGACREQAGFFRDGMGVAINSRTALSAYRAVP